MPNIHLLSYDAGWERWSPAARVRARGPLLASVSDRHGGLFPYSVMVVQLSSICSEREARLQA